MRQGRTRTSTGTGCSTADAFFARSRHYPPARVVTFEGVDGSGKSTQAELLQEWLQKEGRDVVTTREPGGTPLGERARASARRRGDRALDEAALFAAARAELVDRVIGPALAEGSVVVCDRYLDSSLAYQGIARGLGVERVLAFNIEAIRGILPDLTFLLLVDVDEARKRSASARDRIEQEEWRSSASSTTATGSSPGSSRSASSRSTRAAPSTTSRRRFVSTFSNVPEQAEAKLLLGAALEEGPRTPTSFHGPPGVGKRAARSPSPRSCSTSTSVSSGGRIPISTSSSPSETRSGSMRSASSAATSTCARSRLPVASTSSSAPR